MASAAPAPPGSNPPINVTASGSGVGGQPPQYVNDLQQLVRQQQTSIDRMERQMDNLIRHMNQMMTANVAQGLQVPNIAGLPPNSATLNVVPSGQGGVSASSSATVLPPSGGASPP